MVLFGLGLDLFVVEVRFRGQNLIQAGENCNIRIFGDIIVYINLGIEGGTRQFEGLTRQVESS